MKMFTVKVSKRIFDKIRENPLYQTLSDSEILETMIKDWIFIFHSVEEEYELNVREVSEK